MAADNLQKNESVAYDWNRSFSEPDLNGTHKHKNRFTISQPHEYIAIDDLKYFRRRQFIDFHTNSNICLYNSDEAVLPFSAFKSEYRRQYRVLDLSGRPTLLRRATSLHLVGSMQLQSEQRAQYHWFTPEDWQFSRTFPIRNPETFQLTENNDDMSSFITYPMIDRSMQILPREAFHANSETNTTKSVKIAQPKENTATQTSVPNTTAAAANKLAEDKLNRDLAAQELHKCHLQQRAQAAHHEPMPSEYKRQFVQFPIEKAHSIPQMSSIRIVQGESMPAAVPEYQDSFKMYANYSKSAPIKKIDNLRYSGAEQASVENEAVDVPEYRDKFNDPPRNVNKAMSLKTDDHLYARGDFTKDVPEYNESFRDPQVKEMPERGKCREPYLRLKGKIEFNPEYRNTYLDFPRSRPIVRKPASSFRLPNSNTSTTTTTDNLQQQHQQASSKRSPQRKYGDSTVQQFREQAVETDDVTNSPEYRRAQYNYQLRERTPPRKIIESDGGGNSKLRKSSDSSLEAAGRPQAMHKRRPSRQRHTTLQNSSTLQPSFEEVGTNVAKKPARFGRRASVLQNAANCRDKSSIVEGNPKYATRRIKHNTENQDSFVVLDEPCKGSNWMKKTWYDS